MRERFNKYYSAKFLLLLFPVFLFIVIRYIIGFNGLYGQDSHEYYRYSKALLDFLMTGIHPGDYFESLYYPLSGAVSGIFLNVLFSLQLISFLSLSGSLFFLYKILKIIYKSEKNITIYLSITFLFSPYVFRNSTVVMSDLLTVFFITASFYFFISFFENSKVKHLALFTFFTTASVMTRYASAAVVIVPLVFMFFHLVINKRWIHILTLTAMTFIVILPHFILRPSNSTEFLSHSYLQDWSPANFFRQDFVASDGNLHFPLPNIFYSFSNFVHPSYLIFGIIFIIFSQLKFFKSRYLVISLFIILVYAVFLSGIPHQNKRFLLLTYPYIVIVLFHGFSRLSSYFSKNKLVLYFLLTAMLVVQIILSIYTFIPAYERNVLEKEISVFLKNNSHKDVYVFDIDISFSSYDVDQNVFNLWKEKYDSFQAGSLVIFNESKFHNKWANMNPMLNWNRLRGNYTLLELKDFGSGWKVYEIK